MVRISLGLYNTSAEIDALVGMLQRIVRHDYQGRYAEDANGSGYCPVDGRPHAGAHSREPDQAVTPAVLHP
jgi:hypothetical protein